MCWKEEDCIGGTGGKSCEHRKREDTWVVKEDGCARV